MTPETERTTHFFWSYLNNFEGADATVSHSLLNSLIEGFMEDKAIIERQGRPDPRASHRWAVQQCSVRATVDS